jgi:hypothetical protein
VLTKLQYSFSLKGSPIRFSQEARKDFDQFKSLYMAELFFIMLVAVIFFLAPHDTGKGNINGFAPFFDTNFTKEFLFYQIFMFIVKSIPVCIMLILACLLVFTSDKLSKFNANQLYIPDSEEETYKPLSWYDKMIAPFKNLMNLDYIMNYKINLGLQ